MGSSSNSPPPENSESKGAFRKPMNDAASRNYRRRSPVAGSSSSGGEEARFSGKERRRDDIRDDVGSGRSTHGGRSDSHRYSSRSDRHDGKHADEDERNSSRLSSHFNRESRGGHSGYKERENEYKSRDQYRSIDRHTRDQDRIGSDRRKYDDRDRHTKDRVDRNDKRDYKRSSKDHKIDQAASYEDLRGHRSDMKREQYRKDHLKHASKNDARDMDDQQQRDEEKKTLDEQFIKDKHYRRAGDRFEEKEEYAVKRSKFSSEVADQKKGFVQDRELVHGVASEQTPVSDSDLAASVDAAKAAALKAAELVNKNLVGTGVMTADQKKKLLWGSKKSNNEEESSRRWNSAMFSDREQQEKFNKLMGVKGDAPATQVPSNQDGKDISQEKLQMDLEKQYTAGLRRRDGRTVGLGL